MTRPFQPRRKIRVGEVLLQRGLITQPQLKQALMAQKHSSEKLGVVLVRHGLVTEAQLQQALREQGWHNAVATVLIAISALVPHVPKMAVQAPVATAQNLQPTSPLRAATGIGGTSSQASQNRPAPSVGSDGAQQVSSRPQSSLHTKPTVAKPLTGFCHPLNGLEWMSQGNNGITHQGRMRYAYDLAAPIGTPVYAMRTGRVIALQDRYPDTGGGRERASKFNYVFIQHDGGYRSVYVHLQQNFKQTIQLKAGDWVNAGDLIGYSGNSGWSSGPHLHIEVQKPSKSPRRFTKTVPFAVKGYCAPRQVAQG